MKLGLSWLSRRAAPTVDPRIRAAAEGDRRAAEALLSELLPRVRNLVRYLVRGDSDVDDIAQEALLAVVRGLSSYRGEGTFEAWVDRVTARATFAWLRRVRMDHARGQVSLEEGLEVPADASSSPDASCEKWALALLLERLPEEQRHALVLHCMVGLSVEEVAREVGVPFETVRSRLRLGKANLRAMHAEDSGLVEKTA